MGEWSVSDVERDRDVSGRGRRRAPEGVVLVSVGAGRERTRVRGAREAHVARIHDLPSLIRALAEESSPRG